MKAPAEEVLFEHSVSGVENVYYIARAANFDAQIRKAVGLVGAAFTAKLFRGRTSLLVIGGGVSGSAAALEAARRDMLVTLLESEESLLPVQRACSTRRLHPHEYEWPLEHYREDRYPRLVGEKRHCPEQMRWQAGLASEIAEKISNRIQRRCPPNLTLSLGARHIPVSLKTLWDDFDPTGAYEYIIICAGASERTKVGNSRFCSYPYWDNDPLEQLSSLAGRRRSRAILISGGGDGGLQDLLRVIYPRLDGKPFSAGRLLAKFMRLLTSCPRFAEWLRRMRRMPKPFRPLAAEMWAEIRELVAAIQTDSRRWRAIIQRIRSLAELEILQGRRTVTLAFKQHSEAFTLNAFLVHLTVEALPELSCLYAGLEVKEISSAIKTHRCAGKAESCCGRPHDVTFRKGKRTLKRPKPFDIIVLRHGSEQVVTGGMTS